jgi:hypothetical protein
MKKRLFPLVFLFLVAFALFTTAADKKPQGLKLKMEKSFEDALKASKQTNNPVLLFCTVGA